MNKNGLIGWETLVRIIVALLFLTTGVFLARQCATGLLEDNQEEKETFSQLSDKINELEQGQSSTQTIALGKETGVIYFGKNEEMILTAAKGEDIIFQRSTNCPSDSKCLCLITEYDSKRDGYVSAFPIKLQIEGKCIETEKQLDIKSDDCTFGNKNARVRSYTCKNGFIIERGIGSQFFSRVTDNTGRYISINLLQKTNKVEISKSGEERLPERKTSNNGYEWPIEDDIKLSSCFGWRRLSNDKQRYNDCTDGIDITGNIGEPVYPITNGIVLSTETKQSGGFGNTVIIEHTTDNKYSRYSHLNSIRVTEGEKLTKETPIGGLGNTGISTAPHLDLKLYTDRSSIEQKDGGINPICQLPKDRVVEVAGSCTYFYNRNPWRICNTKYAQQTGNQICKRFALKDEPITENPSPFTNPNSLPENVQIG